VEEHPADADHGWPAADRVRKRMIRRERVRTCAGPARLRPRASETRANDEAGPKGRAPGWREQSAEPAPDPIRGRHFLDSPQDEIPDKLT